MMSNENRGEEVDAGTDQPAPAPAPSDNSAEEVIIEAEVIDAEVVAEDVGADRLSADIDALSSLTRERDEYLELAQRARADFENYKRRVGTQTAEAEQRGRANLARGILPALDNLERALLAAGVDPAERPDPGGEPPSEEVSARDALARGVALVYRELGTALERSGVVPFDPVGERFDPSVHEAISTARAEGVESGLVLETLERGYRVDSQVIRPARVVVNQ